MCPPSSLLKVLLLYFLAFGTVFVPTSSTSDISKNEVRVILLFSLRLVLFRKLHALNSLEVMLSSSKESKSIKLELLSTPLLKCILNFAPRKWIVKESNLHVYSIYVAMEL